MPCCLTAPSLARINVFIRKVLEVLDIHLRTIYGDVSWPSVTEIRLKFAHINLQWISGVNEIKIAPCTWFSRFPFLFQCFAWWNVFQELPSLTMETHLVGYVVCDWYFQIQWNFMTCLMIPVKSYQKGHIYFHNHMPGRNVNQMLNNVKHLTGVIFWHQIQCVRTIFLHFYWILISTI